MQRIREVDVREKNFAKVSNFCNPSHDWSVAYSILEINSEGEYRMADKTIVSSNSDTSQISVPAARLAIGAAVAVPLLLVSLHVLSPEFDPSWRMVSEYANGQYSWVLSLMFVSWAVGSWASAFAIRSQVKTIGGKIGLGFLIAAGVGEAMASIFDINNSLHSVSALIGIPSLPIAAMFISVSLARSQAWRHAKKVVLLTANLTWISLVLMAAAMFIMFTGLSQAGVDLNAGAPATLPSGVIALGGWANRLLIVVYCVWAMSVVWQAIRLQIVK